MANNDEWWNRRRNSRREFEEFMLRTFNQPAWETRSNQDKAAREEADRAAKKAKKR